MTYLSIVNIGRNDNHGGDYLRRLQRSVDSIASGRRYSLDLEYVFVDWGSEGVGMEDTINWPIPTRIIKVSRHFVDAIPNPDRVFLVPHALNIGIRRTEGQFILTTGSDTLFSGGMMEFLVRQELDLVSYYRVNMVRRDTEGRIKTVHYTAPNIPHYGAAGDFILMSRESYHNIHGWPELPIYNSVDGMVVWLANQAGLKEVVLPYEVEHLEHGCEDFSSCVKPWDDFKPYAVQNGDDWGMPDLIFDEVRRGYYA